MAVEFSGPTVEAAEATSDADTTVVLGRLPQSSAPETQAPDASGEDSVGARAVRSASYRSQREFVRGAPPDRAVAAVLDALLAAGESCPPDRWPPPLRLPRAARSATRSASPPSWSASSTSTATP